MQISNPFFTAGVMKPAAGGGGGAVTVTKIGEGNGDFSGNFNIATTGAVAVGEGIIVIGFADIGASVPTLTLSDGTGNSYAQHANSSLNNAGNTWCLIMASAYAANGVASGTNINVQPSVQGHWHIVIYKVSQMASSGHYDVGATKNNAFGTAHDTGTTAAIAGGAEFVIAAFVGNPAPVHTITGGGYTQLDSMLTSDSGRKCTTAWRTVSSGTQQCTATTDVNNSTTGAIAVFKNS
jgi:hypothetical protein